MTNFIVDVDGTQATNVIDVEYDTTEGGDVGQAVITVMNSSTNRSLFSSGANIVIQREDPDNPGTYEADWTGEVLSTPANSNRRNATLEVTAETRAGQLEYGKVARPFIELDTGEIVRQAVNKKVEPETSVEYITTGSDTTDWSSNANVFERANITAKSLNQFGDDVLYADFLEGNSDTWYVRNTSLSTNVAPGRRILTVEMRLAVNNRGSVFDAELELRDHDGITYTWDVPVPGYTGFETYELTPSSATYGSGTLLTDGSVELRVTTDGGLPEDRALAIDMIRTTPFSLIDRQVAISTSGVDDTGRTVTRRLDGPILDELRQFAIDDGAVIYVDTNDVLNYETAGDTAVDPSLNITDDGSTPVVTADVDRDFDVRNRVTVQGADDLQATFEDEASIDFYNTEAPKEKPITDTALRTDDDVEKRARGYLSENAWEDTAMTFTIADAAYRNVAVGRAIDVTWGPEDINGTFIVSNVKTTAEGYVSVGLTGNTTA